MIDPVLERRYADCKELLELWRVFHDYYEMAVKGDNLTHENEEKFLAIKSRIAMLHDSFTEALTSDQAVAQGMVQIIEGAITLRHVHRLSLAETRKAQIEWHESYLLLTETVTILDEKRKEIEPINERSFRAQKRAAAVRQKTLNFVKSTGFKVTVGIIAFLCATVGVQMMGIYDFNKLGDNPFFRPAYQMAIAVVRVAVADYPWPSIVAMSRRDFKAAGGTNTWETPEVKPGEKPDAFLNYLTSQTRGTDPAAAQKLREQLSTAKEYQKEMVKTKASGVKGSQTVYIHSFRFADVNGARNVRDTYKTLTDRNNRLLATVKLAATPATLNIVAIITGSDGGPGAAGADEGVVNDVFVNIYDGNK